MIFLLLSFAIPLCLGILITFVVFPPQKINAPSLSFLLCLGTGIGIGIVSCVYFISLLLNLSGHIYVIELTLTLLIIASFPLLKKIHLNKGQRFFSETHAKFKFHQIFAISFYGALISSVISIVISFLQEPHGKWDAWLIWNLHARFIIRSGEHWRDFFSSGLDWSHLDYPLLIPLSIVRCWKYMASESLYAPFLLSALFTIMTIGLICSSLFALRSRSQGYLSGLILMGSPFFIILGASQTADIPLSFFFVATLVALSFHDHHHDVHYPVLILAGITAGLSAWTKNEGLLFLVGVIVIRLITVTYVKGWKASAKQMMWFIFGLLPILMVVMYFKVKLAPATDLFSGQTMQEMLDRLFDFKRYYQILLTYALVGISFTQGIINIQTGIRFNPGVANIILLTVYLVLIGVKIDQRDKLTIVNGLMIILFILAGYFFIYVITPHDLSWHLPTSLNRLFIQLWPSAVFLFCMIARTPEEAFTSIAVSRHKAPPSQFSIATGKVKSKKTDRRKKEGVPF